MSNTEELKSYLIDKVDGFLLNDDNNGKTIMLSGKWGAGKTHFWQNEISPILKEEQTNIYVSLYGKESIDEIKFDILKEAYNSQVKEDFISKSASLISTIAPSFGEKSLTDGFAKLNKEAKGKKATEILKSGSVICLDDFERKSKKVDLNDLFGFISQLAIDMNCKMVIILNSDVFEGEEANVFKNVKEKTVNKYFHFEPTPKELFTSVAKDKKYNKLNDYKEEILKAIEETEELNARIYIQVLDNCLEWVEKGYDSRVLKALIFTTINFIVNDFVLNLHIGADNLYDNMALSILNTEGNVLPVILVDKFRSWFRAPKGIKNISEDTKLILSKTSSTYLIDLIQSDIAKLDRDTKNSKYTENTQQEIRNWLRDNNKFWQAFWKYAYRLYHMDSVDEKNYQIISDFVKSGILPKQT